MTTDFPAMLARLEARQVNVRAVLNVTRVTVWYWRNGMRKPNGVHTATLIALDRGEEISRSVNHC